MKLKNEPPSLFLRFFRWYAHPKLRNHIEGDLIEVYNDQVSGSKLKADLNFILDVLLLFRPGIIRPVENRNLTTSAMFKSYFKIGWRSLLTNKGYSLINVGGLAIGITVAMFIGLWIHDELSYDKYHANYDRIGQIMSAGQDPQSGEFSGGYALQFPIGATLKNSYPQYFKHVLMAWWFGEYTVSAGEEKFARPGVFMESGALEMLSLKMIKGNYNSLDNPHSVVISNSMAEAIFGKEDPMNKTLSIDNMMNAEVTGVYEDLPRNNKFAEVKFIAPWSLWISAQQWLQTKDTDWDNRMTNTYVELQPNTTFAEVNAAIHDLFEKNVPKDFYEASMKKYRPFVQAVPMSTWHLYSEFEDGKPAAGRITFVWLFFIVGVFVLLLACINFINLSTARSEKRAREVGVRKSIGAVRNQLVSQFLAESLMVVLVAFCISVVALILLQPMFNQLADKEILLPFNRPVFWLIVVCFIAFTGLMAGVYPAFYLSSFQPVKVLKGVLRVGRLRSLPRKVLVVIQFTVSVTLIIGTVIVYNQIDYARNRPIGYYRSGLISMSLSDPAFDNKWSTLRTELLATGVVADAGTASQPLTDIWNTTGGYTWPGKDPGVEAEFVNVRVGVDFGKSVGWEIVAGRDFTDSKADSTNSIILNEAAIKFMGLENPVGQMFTDINENGDFKWSREIIGVVKDIVAGSPYQPVFQSFYHRGQGEDNVLFIRMEPSVSANEALLKIKDAVEKVVPTAMFDYKFVDEEFGAKFSQEQRVGNLAAVFSVLAIFISCLGLFGLASYVAEQRTKEIGIRKVMGASILTLWQMLSRDFIVLVVVACFIAIPVGYYVMNSWLEAFDYRTEISLWVFVITCGAAIVITLLTVSYQSIRAARMNPVKSLRME